jgi:prepilin-type processing-associated H-X9-DG protein
VKKPVILVATGLVLFAVLARFDAALLLLFGWVAFLGRVLPRVAVDWPSVTVGLAALILFTLGVHQLGRMWQRHRTADVGRHGKGWRLRWSAAIVVAVFLMFVAGIAIIGMTHQVGWLLTAKEPLVGTTLRNREWGRSSNSNLRSIGLGLHNYHDHQSSFPPGGIFRADGTMLHSWETAILPFLSYSSREIDLARPWTDPVNEKHFRTVLPEFINPDFRTAPLVDGNGYGLSHYAANSRILAANKAMKLTDITDGPSHTILIGEVNAQFQPWGHPVNWRDPAKGINTSPYGFGGPRNSSGATFLMADGSVRFLSDKTGASVLEALSSPAGRTDPNLTK